MTAILNRTDPLTIPPPPVPFARDIRAPSSWWRRLFRRPWHDRREWISPEMRDGWETLRRTDR